MMSRASGAGASAPALPCSTTSGDGVARRVIGGEADEQRVRAEFPGQVLRVEWPCSRASRRHPAHLGRAGLAGHLHAGERSRASGAVPPCSLTTAHMPCADQRAATASGSPSGPVLGAARSAARPPMVRVRCGCTARPVAMREA